MEEKKGKREGKVNSSVNQNLKLLGEPPMKLIEINPKNVPKKRANIKTKKEVSNDADEAFDDQNSCSEDYTESRGGRKPKKCKESDEFATKLVWKDILENNKLLVSFSPWNYKKPLVTICYASQEFSENFGFNESDTASGLEFNKLMGPCSSKDDMLKIQEAILSNNPSSQFINLYNKAGTSLSSHMHIQPLKPKLTRESLDALYAVVTIRSASNIGNSMHHGIGILGLGSQKH